MDLLQAKNFGKLTFMYSSYSLWAAPPPPPPSKQGVGAWGMNLNCLHGSLTDKAVPSVTITIIWKTYFYVLQLLPVGSPPPSKQGVGAWGMSLDCLHGSLTGKEVPSVTINHHLENLLLCTPVTPYGQPPAIRGVRLGV